MKSIKRLLPTIGLTACLGLLGAVAFTPDSQAQSICSAAFNPEHKKNSETPSLYIDRDLVSKNSRIELNGKWYRLLDYYPSSSGDLLVVETRKGKTKVIPTSKIKNHFVTIDHVRLAELLNYKNDRVIERFMRDHGVDRIKAEATFTELMKWFYVLHRYTAEGLYFETHPNHFTLGMYNETHAIDEMWHEFILFTIDYHDFGRNLLGYYQHHQPFDREVPKTREQKTADRLRMYAYIKETLGTETLRDWFVDYRFSDPKMPIGFHVDVPDSMLAP
jgi:hypothetical protein